MPVARCVRTPRTFSTGSSTRSKSFVPSSSLGACEETLKRLKTLKNEQLKQLAVACGTPCSGTKDSLSRGLAEAIYGKDNAWAGPTADSELSIVSIDMGIRNLAYCHVRTRLSRGVKKPQSIQVDAWRRLNVSTGAVHGIKAGVIGSTSARLASEANQEEGEPPPGALKESFDPTLYAERAYELISRLLEEHRPTHILIERQRFRSGGGPAVQEWTLRVGMFEFMLYATLHTLKAKGEHNGTVVPVLPPMVNRYWISQIERYEPKADVKPTSAALKKYKIDHVKTILEGNQSIGRQLGFTEQASGLASDFLTKVKGGRQNSRTGSITKLDDLSDCFLQVLGWIAWQEHRQSLRSALKNGSIESYDPLALW